MGITNTKYSYGSVAVTLHWLLFFMVVGALASGKYFSHLSDSEKPGMLFLLHNHKTVGILIAILMAVRLVWKVINSSVTNAEQHRSFFEGFLSFVVHWGLYAAIIGQAIIGMMMTHTAGREVALFGNEIPMAQIAAALPEYSQSQWRNFHYLGSLALYGLIGMHFLGVIYHGIQNTDNFKKMWYGYNPRH